MSRFGYATQIKCDWPGGNCPVTGMMPDLGIDQWRQTPPPGWASFRPGPHTVDGRELNDFCPEHAAQPLLVLADLLSEWMLPKETADVT